MVSAGLRALLTAAPGAGTLRGDGVRCGRATHPVCGDEVELTLRLDPDGRIAELAWRACGCPAAMAVAAAAHGALPGRAPADAEAALTARIGELGGLAGHERHALTLVLDALRAAV